MNIADYTAKVLSDRGVRFVFGIPGGPSIPYMEAWREAGIEFILTSHEASAGIMADVTYRMTGVPGVCHATFGPGATNLSTGTGCALLDRSAVLALTTEVPGKMIGRTTQMNIDHQQLFLPVTKATFRLSQQNAAEVLDEAFTLSTAELPGPVHIGLPSDISGYEVHERCIKNQVVHGTGAGTGTEAGGGAGTIIESPENEARLVSLIRKAKRPLLAVGLTAARMQTGKALQRFLDRSPMPVVLTPMAKGVLSSEHPCYAGVLFHASSDKLRQVTDNSDLVIGIGYDPVEYNYESWMPDVPLLHFGTRATDMPTGREIVQVSGTSLDWFRVLEETVMKNDYLSGRGVDSIRGEMDRFFSECADKWGPAAVLQILQNELPENNILTCDVGSHLHMAGQFWPVINERRFIITNGWSSMGFGIPSAIAASLNKPGTTVTALTGDGGFLMSAGEMMTARRYNINIKVVIISDRELNLIKVKQSWKGLNPYATTLLEGDLFEADRFLGVPVHHAADAESLQHAIRSAMAINGPVIINASVPGDDYNKIIVRQ